MGKPTLALPLASVGLPWRMAARELEDEVMTSEDAVRAYDALTRQFQHVLHAGFVETVVNMSPEQGLFLDLCTGTGWIAIGVAQANPLATIVAVDLSPTMLKVARANALVAGVADRISFIQGDATDLPFPDGAFDAVFSHNAMHHLPLPAELIREMARVSSPGAALVVRDLKRHVPIVREVHVQLFGAGYDQLMKKEYRDSVGAALCEEEWLDLLQGHGWNGAVLARNFVTHFSLQRPAHNARARAVTVRVPWYLRLAKRLYC